MDEVNEAFIEERYGIPGRAYADFAVLRGDPSDGLPGVRGVGEKLATSLVARYGNLDGILAAIEAGEEGVALGRVKRDLDYVKRAAQVVAIPTDLPIPKVDLTRPRREPDEKLYEVADGAGLGGALRRLVTALTS
jgi:5'-3' exonuclease